MTFENCKISGGKSANEVFNSLQSCEFLNLRRTKGIQYIRLKFLGTLIVLCGVLSIFRTNFFCSDISNFIAYGNEAYASSTTSQESFSCDFFVSLGRQFYCLTILKRKKGTIPILSYHKRRHTCILFLRIVTCDPEFVLPFLCLNSSHLPCSDSSQLRSFYLKGLSHV